MNDVVLDASAVLAVFFDEHGAELVAPVLFGAAISAVNFSEVLKKALEKRGQLEIIQGFLSRQALRVIAFDRQQAIGAAALLPHTAAYGLSFADRACLSLGIQLGYEVLTAEQRMSQTPLRVAVRLIRQPN